MVSRVIDCSIDVDGTTSQESDFEVSCGSIVLLLRLTLLEWLLCLPYYALRGHIYPCRSYFLVLICHDFVSFDQHMVRDNKLFIKAVETRLTRYRIALGVFG